ncbi:4-hydroxy-tetrahydrodipicolinate reductase [Candidatus Binatia bacterium]|nr:4-hydroxy-tetrahydrodipicolinate reductase [Candidatus Binatia bacterium]
MGRMLVTLAASDPALELRAGFEAPGHRDAGTDIGRIAGIADVGVPLTTEIPTGPLDGAVLIDFTAPEASLAHLRAAAERRFGVVLGTTGFTAEQQKQVEQLASKVPCMQAPNMSLGVTVLLGLVEQAARLLGQGFDIEISETHHRRKKDSPSGTALALARAAAAGRDANLEQWAVYGREGIVGERPTEQIGIMALRGGDVVGDHTVYFYGTGERVELSHRAQSRESFAAGALRAAAWLGGRPPGLYSMRDVLGLPRPQ